MRIKWCGGRHVKTRGTRPSKYFNVEKGRIFVTNPSVVLLNKYLFEIHLDKLYTGAERLEKRQIVRFQWKSRINVQLPH